MKRHFPVALALASLLVAGSGELRAEAEVGAAAPPLEPTAWFNAKSNMSWSQLKGRVILVEKWATW